MKAFSSHKLSLKTPTRIKPIPSPNLLVLLIDLAVIIAISVLGWLLARLILGNPSLLESISLGFPLGAGCFTFVLFMAAWIGAPISKQLMVGVYVALMSIFLIAMWQVRRARGHAAFSSAKQMAAVEKPRSRLILWISLAVFAAISLLGAYISVGRSHANYDTVAMWALKGYGFAWEGDLFEGASWGGAWTRLPTQHSTACFRL